MSKFILVAFLLISPAYSKAQLDSKDLLSDNQCKLNIFGHELVKELNNKLPSVINHVHFENLTKDFETTNWLSLSLYNGFLSGFSDVERDGDVTKIQLDINTIRAYIPIRFNTFKYEVGFYVEQQNSIAIFKSDGVLKGEIHQIEGGLILNVKYGENITALSHSVLFIDLGQFTYDSGNDPLINTIIRNIKHASETEKAKHLYWFQRNFIEPPQMMIVKKINKVLEAIVLETEY